MRSLLRRVPIGKAGVHGFIRGVVVSRVHMVSAVVFHYRRIFNGFPIGVFRAN